MNLTLQQLAAVGTLMAMLLGGGLWLGKLENRVAQIERVQTYLHGEIKVP